MKLIALMDFLSFQMDLITEVPSEILSSVALAVSSLRTTSSTKVNGNWEYQRVTERNSFLTVAPTLESFPKDSNQAKGLFVGLMDEYTRGNLKMELWMVEEDFSKEKINSSKVSLKIIRKLERTN